MIERGIELLLGVAPLSGPRLRGPISWFVRCLERVSPHGTMLWSTACGVLHIFELMREVGGERLGKVGGSKGGGDVVT